MTQPRDERPAYLDGAAAIEWFVRTKGGPEIYDRHLAALDQVFERGAILRVRAATDPRNGEPQTLIIEVSQAGATEDESWSLMLRAQEHLIEQEEFLREQFRVSPFSRIALSLGTTGEAWDEFARRIEGGM